LRERWERIQQFDDNFCTREESADEIQRKMSAMPENMAGNVLISQTELKIEEFHDRGGLGDVYRAHDMESTREVAVKLLRVDRQNTSNLDDFRREAQIIGGLLHPGIVSIYGTGETIDGRPFYTMPFLDRGNLRAAVTRYHRNHPAQVESSEKDFRDLVYRLVGVCKTVAYAHSRGIVHRDLKAENVLLGKYGETLVIDWGCATRVERAERFKVDGERTLQLNEVGDSSSSAGLTLRYASPEQLKGNQPVGPESDIYSLGSILYLLLTGQSPLEHEADEQIRRRVLSGAIEPPESVKPKVPHRLSAICSKAMSVMPENRYETAMDMAEDLERYLSDETVSVCKDSLGIRLARRVRRNRTASLFLLATLLVASAVLSLAFAGQSYFASLAKETASERLELAATMAGDLGGFEIDRRLQLLEKEAMNFDLIAAMQALQDDAPDSELWELRVKNLVHQFRGEVESSGVKLESMFLTNATGTQIARAPVSQSIGKNFAFRHYFHGLKQDLDPASPESQENPPPASALPIVSNAYVSTNTDSTGQYPIKTAFTVAVMGKDSKGNPQVLGRLGMSMKINDLAIFDRLKSLSVDAVLIETRDYDWGSGQATGLVLDRIDNSEESVGIPTSPLASGSKQTMKDVKDAMPRLATESVTEVVTSSRQSRGAFVIPSFFDPQINSKPQEAACARIQFPYRSNAETGWTVIFIDAAEEPE
jgi:serine/threonine protein kinase